MQITAIRRADIFSPQSVEKDRLIISRTLEILHAQGHEVRLIDEREVQKGFQADVILSMARSKSTLGVLKCIQSQGIPVFNAPEAVQACHRTHLQQVMEQLRLPLPPKEGKEGYWIKRGDGWAVSEQDVRYCPDVHALKKAEQNFIRQGISSYTVSAHVPGDLIKFYGVGADFFAYFYPGDDMDFKFEDELRNGTPQHYPFEVARLHADALRLSRHINLPIYGGDAIVSTTGTYHIIDFNDWPSFSRCREQAAQAIAHYINKKKYEI